MRKPDKRALQRSFYASLGRLIGVGLAASAGTFVRDLLNPKAGWLTVGFMAVVSFVLIWYSEYEREIH